MSWYNISHPKIHCSLEACLAQKILEGIFNSVWSDTDGFQKSSRHVTPSHFLWGGGDFSRCLSMLQKTRTDATGPFPHQGLTSSNEILSSGYLSLCNTHFEVVVSSTLFKKLIVRQEWGGHSWQAKTWQWLDAVHMPVFHFPYLPDMGEGFLIAQPWTIFHM